MTTPLRSIEFRFLLMAASLMTLCAAGCGDSGPRVVPVKGKVLIDGNPVEKGFVRFVPDSGRPSSCALASDGSFSLSYSADKEGALVGHHRVEVAGMETLGPTKVIWHAPQKYASIATSGLSQDIEGPTDDLVIQLSWGKTKGPLVIETPENDSF